MKFKKSLCLILSTLMVLFTFTFAVPSYAISESKGLTALKAEFLNGKNELDYCYYSPVKDKNDDTLYPLIVWLHGNSSGDYPRQQLNRNAIARWASDEVQSTFPEGGAYVFLPRDPTHALSLSWEGQINTLKRCIDKFIAEQGSNVDTTRIYIGGYSLGGKCAFKMAAAYPDYFAAVFPMSPVHTPIPSEIIALKDTPIWLFTCETDTYPELNPVSVRANWKRITNASDVPEKCRWSRFEGVYRPDGSFVSDNKHNTWDAVINDLFMKDGSQYKGMTVVDGTGKEIKLTYPDGFLSWLMEQQLDKVPDSSSHMNVIINFIDMVLSVIKNVINTIIGA